MTERCEKCGAELYARQQFCRRCGAPVARAKEDAPTQILQPGGANSGPVNSGGLNSGPVDSGPFVGTSPLGGGARTDAVGPKPATAYQPQASSYAPMPPSFQQAQTPAGFQHTSPLVGQPFGSQPLAVGAPARKRRGWVWLVALLVVFLLGAGAVGGAGYVIWRARQRALSARAGIPGVPNVPRPPDVNIPTDLGDKINKALKAAGIPQPLDESGATVTGTDTVITKTFQLDDDATFSVQGLTGNFTITGTDGDQAELRVTKHGGSPEERKAANVSMAQTDERVLLVGGGPPSGVELSYEIKLPRDLSKVEINSDHGDLKFADLGGAVNVTLRQGNLEFKDLTGAVHSRLVNGDVKVSLDKSDRDGDQDISVVNGNIEATVADGADVNLKAESINGDISADDRLGLKVEKRPAGHAVSGQLGDGGQALELKTVNGGIKLKKQ
ncbi:MAG TPA: DUF4097 family beta strand repeat-containing protein [Pyrinomonadaceae bacterium]|nr:DUF4097 family beta strand repeat-containing protein [Pyrinomonadaceae bacterium]